MNIFVFDIETIPDTKAGRRLYHLEELDDVNVAQAMAVKHPSNNGFLPHYLHRIVAISVVLRSKDKVKIWSLGDLESDESDLIQRFFAGIEKYTPTLVSWNGCGFDLPVLHYRALIHSVQAARYWETGDEDQVFRWNNYLNRFHARHLDLMDVLSGYQSRAFAPLDAIATLLGCPGKMGMDGGKVWECFQKGEIENIRHYCETDVLNTYLVYLRFEVMRGKLQQSEYEHECQLLRETLQQENKSHFDEFLDRWK